MTPHQPCSGLFVWKLINIFETFILIPNVTLTLTLIDLVMGFIWKLTDIFEKMGPRFQCLAIHSDIPFEDQLEAFQPAAAGRVKVMRTSICMLDAWCALRMPCACTSHRP